MRFSSINRESTLITYQEILELIIQYGSLLPN